MPTFLEKFIQSFAKRKPFGRSDSPLYHKFYEQLHAENQQVAEAAREVKNCLIEGDPSKALAICDRMLALHPGHVLFEGLRLEGESKERESRFAYVQQVSAEAESFPDLDRRVTHLREALSRYPRESQLGQLVRHAIAKRSFINDLIAQAGVAESSGKYLDALERWYTVAECHPLMPDLRGHIQRVERLREREVAAARRGRFVEDISRLLSVGEYERGLNQCRSALMEFPGDPHLLELHKEAKEKALQAAAAEKLLLEYDEQDSRAAHLMLDESAETHSPWDAAAGSAPKQLSFGDTVHDEASSPVSRRDIVSPRVSRAIREVWSSAGDLGERTMQVCRRLLANTKAMLYRRPFSPMQGLVVILLLGAAGLLWLTYSMMQAGRDSQEVVENPILTALDIAAAPEGAEVFINGKKAGASRIQTGLAPGSHTISVTLAGYKSQSIPLILESAAKTLSVKLQPLPMELHVVTDQTTGSVWLDEMPKGTLRADGMLISGVTPGVHTLKVRSPEGEAVTVFDFRPGQSPVAVSLPVRPTPAVLFVASSNEKSRVACNCAPAAIRIGDSAQAVPADGLELDLAEGAYPAELSVLGGRKLTIQGSRVPVATVAFYWGQPSVARALSTDDLLKDVDRMISSRQYQAALVKVGQALYRDPGDDRIPILQKRLERLITIDP